MHQKDNLRGMIFDEADERNEAGANHKVPEGGGWFRAARPLPSARAGAEFHALDHSPNLRAAWQPRESTNIHPTVMDREKPHLRGATYIKKARHDRMIGTLHRNWPICYVD